MVQQPTVSVLIPTFNRGDLLPQALASMRNQTRPPDEIVVVVDGSTDGTEAFLGTQTGLKVLRQENAGKPSALNHGLRHASGDLVWFFDDDDVALPDGLERHLNALQAHPEAGFTFSPGLISAHDPETLAPVPLARQPELPPFDGDSLLATLIPSMLWPFHLQGALIKRECVNAAGGFDPRLLRSQDYDMLLQLAWRFRAWRMDEPAYLHRCHDGLRGTRDQSHHPKDNLKVWTKFGREIWERWRGRLTLMDHLPRVQGLPQAPDPDRNRDACVARAAAVFRRGLWQEGLENLEGALGQPASAPALGPFAAATWAQAVVGLREHLFDELLEEPAWTGWQALLRRPAAAHLNWLTLHALRHRAAVLRSAGNGALAGQLESHARTLNP